MKVLKSVQERQVIRELKAFDVGQGEGKNARRKHFRPARWLKRYPFEIGRPEGASFSVIIGCNTLSLLVEVEDKAIDSCDGTREV